MKPESFSSSPDMAGSRLKFRQKWSKNFHVNASSRDDFEINAYKQTKIVACNWRIEYCIMFDIISELSVDQFLKSKACDFLRIYGIDIAKVEVMQN